MTIVSSGAISINSLVGEYGGSSPHSMSEYYKGGGLVANHSNNPNVPTSGAISLSNFYGANNTAPYVADTTAGFTSDYGSYTIAKTTTYYRGRIAMLLLTMGSIDSGNSTFQWTSGGTVVTLGGFAASLEGSTYGLTLQLDAGSVGGTHHTVANGKTVTWNGYNCGTINGSNWVQSYHGNLYGVALTSNQQNVYNNMADDTSYTLSIS